MILLLGASGYVGSAFVKELERRELTYYSAIRNTDMYENWGGLQLLIHRLKPELVINAAAYIPSPSVDECKNHISETLQSNISFPAQLVSGCGLQGCPLMHLSTGCVFDEAREYSEDDNPTRGWDGHCGVYVGSKLVGEYVVSRMNEHYILRLRLPFDQYDSPRNYFSKLSTFPKVYDHVNSLTHRQDFAKAALDLWEMGAPFGTYHVANPGQISAREVVSRMVNQGLMKQMPEIVESETTGCRLSVQKLLNAGVKIRSVEEAVEDSINNWKPEWK